MILGFRSQGTGIRGLGELLRGDGGRRARRRRGGGEGELRLRGALRVGDGRVPGGFGSGWEGETPFPPPLLG